MAKITIEKIESQNESLQQMILEQKKTIDLVAIKMSQQK